MASAKNQSLSINLVMSSAIKGADFLQVSVNKLHKTAKTLERINLLKATKFPALNKNLKTLDGTLQKIQARTAKMSRQPLTMMNAKGLTSSLKEQYRIQRGIEKSTKQTAFFSRKHTDNVKRNNKTRRKVSGGSVMGTAFAFAPLALPILEGARFQQATRDVEAITDSKYKKDLSLLGKTFLELGGKTKWTPVQVAQGGKYMSMAGYSPKDIASSEHAVLSLATVGDLDLASASDIATNIQGASGYGKSELGLVVDMMAKVVTNKNIDVNGLGESMKYALTSSLPYLGKDALPTALGLTGFLADQGVKDGQAGRHSGIMLRRLTAPPKKAGKALDALDVDVWGKDGKLKQLPTIFQSIKDGFKANNYSDKQKAFAMKDIFGGDAAPSANIAMGIDSSVMATYINSVKNVKRGLAEEMALLKLDTLTGSVILLGSAWSRLSVSMSKPLLKPMQNFFESLTSGLTSLSAWSEKNQTLSAGIYAIATAVGIGAVALTAFGFVATMMGTGLTALAGGFALLASPIVLTIGAIVAAGVLIYQNWEFLKQKATSIWNGIVEAIKHPFKTYFTWIETKFNNLIKLFNQVKGLLGLADGVGLETNQTVKQRQDQKGIGLSLQMPVNNTNFDPTKKVGMKLNKGFSLKDQLAMETLPVESPSAVANAQIDKAKQVTNNNMQQTHVTNNVTINNQGGTIDQAEFNRAFQTKMADDAHHQADTTFNDVKDVAS